MVGMNSFTALFVAFGACWALTMNVRAAEKTKQAAAAPAITNTAGLQALAGKIVSVTGEVSFVAVSKNKFHTFIKFTGVSSGGFTVIVTAPNISDIERSAGSSLEAALSGRTITVTGPVSLFESEPQIELITSDQLRVHP